MAQVRNAELVDNLRQDFQHRAECNFAWKSACSAFLALPGLRGFWPLGAFDSAGNAWDQSGNGRTLTYNAPGVGIPLYNAYDLAPYFDLDGTGYLNRADEAGLDILGNEAFVAAAIQGLTLGGWFWRDVQQQQGLIGKCQGGNNSYRIYNTGVNDTIQFGIWDAGGVQRTVNGTSAGTLGWEFIVGRFEPNNNEVNLTIDNTETTAATPAATTIRNQNAAFAIGNENGNVMDGRASMCFLCAAALPDITIASLYQQTRRMFYV